MAYSIDAGELKREWESMDNFSLFHEYRDQDGTWNRLRQARLPPDIPPELLYYAQGFRFMAGKLDDDIRIHKLIRQINATRFGVQVRGTTQGVRDLESDWKLCIASYWDNDLNQGRELDSYVYEGQLSLGISVPRLRWKKQPVKEEDGGRPVSSCPLVVDKTLVDSIRWSGNPFNPEKAICRYSLSVIDCDIKNADGERPYYTSKEDNTLGWTQQMLATDYQNNAGKSIDVIVRDAEDPVAMCPISGCYHRKRRICVYICPPGGSADKYEEVEEYDSPFEKCSFMVVGSDVRYTVTDPHYMFRPSDWVLFDIVHKYNLLLTELFIAHRREQSDETKYINAATTNPEVLQALHGDEDTGQSREIDRPEAGNRKMAVIGGSVQSYGLPSTAQLDKLLDEFNKEYALRRPNPALTGQMVISETTGTAAQLQVSGAGVTLGDDLVNWDGGIKRIWRELRHGILFTSYYEPENAQTKYIAYVSGRENVIGYRGKKAGEEVYLDAKKCQAMPNFYVMTSKQTPNETRDRKIMAITGFKEGIYTKRDLLEEWDIYDIDAQETDLFREDVRRLVNPLVERRIALILARQSQALTGIDFGESDLLARTVPDVGGQGGRQTYNTQAANNERLHAPPVDVAPTGTPQGGTSGLA